MGQMNHKNRILELYSLLAVDLITIILSYVIASFIRFGSPKNLPDIQLHYFICLCCMFFCTAFTLLLDWNRNFIKRGYFIEFVTVLKYNIIMVFIVSSFLFLIKQAEFFSRLLFGFFFLSNLILSFAFHSLLKKLLREYLRSEHCKVQMLVVTESMHVDHIMEVLKGSLPLNYEISALAILDEVADSKESELITVITKKEELFETARQIPLDEVFIYTSKEPSDYISELIRNFESMGVACHYSLNITDMNSGESTIGKVGSYTVVTYSLNQIDYRRRMIKRIMDLTGGFLGLLFTILITPFVALAIKIDSKGPVFFAQTRIGKNGRRFQIYKFRSMYQDAEKRKKELLQHNEMDGLMFKMKCDPRITHVGKFLRKTSIDELPQFYNVLRGDMSLVGTRPPTVDEFEKYNLYYRRRLSMTPGLTGLWQVSGRSKVEKFDDVVKYDLKYIDEWSLSLDIKILIQTIWVVLFRKGSE